MAKFIATVSRSPFPSIIAETPRHNNQTPFKPCEQSRERPSLNHLESPSVYRILCANVGDEEAPRVLSHCYVRS